MNLKEELKITRKSQIKLKEEVLFVREWVDKLIAEANSINDMLFKLKADKSQKTETKVVVNEKSIASSEDFKDQLEFLLKGSMDHLEDRLSQRILNMLKELKTTTGSVKEAKMKEIKGVVEEESVDLSKLFIHEKVESNIDDVGVEEKQTTGIAKSLKRLREMKNSNPDKDIDSNDEK